MFKAPEINEILESNKVELFKATTQREFNKTLRKNFKHYGLQCRTFRRTMPRADFYMGGLYAFDRDTIHLQIIISNKVDVVPIKECWAEFKFLFSQTLQHEMLHRHQWFMRGDDFEYDDMGAIDHRYFENLDIEEERGYLSDTDEIDSYSHDIAMEIKFYYPHKNPIDVLRTIDKKRKVWSYSYYKRTFKDVPEWSQIKRKLLKKTYLWLPQTQVYF